VGAILARDRQADGFASTPWMARDSPGPGRTGDKVALTLSDEDKKSASATIAGEALKVVPEADKQMAGRSFGGALTNFGATLENVTLWLRVITSIPGGAVGLGARLAQRWRSLPEGRRVTPPTKLLVEAATRYAVEDEDELRARYERLLASAMDSETSSRVHPAFVTMLGEMTATEAGLLDRFAIGGYFESFDALLSTLGFPLDEHGLEVGVRNLIRLGLVDTAGPARVEPLSADTPELKQELAQLDGGIHVEEARTVSFEDGDAAYVTRRSHHRLTALGRDFLAVVGKRTP
jgi:hypothetical protein